MNMTAKVPQHIGVGVFRPVRHTDILGPVVDIHLRNDCPEAIVPIVVTLDENKLTVQPLLELPVFIYPAFFSTFEDEITQKENCIVRLNPLIVLSDDRFIHFLSRLKWPLAISDDIEVRKVII